MGGKHNYKSKSETNKTRHHSQRSRGGGGGGRQARSGVGKQLKSGLHNNSNNNLNELQLKGQLEENLSFCGCGFLGIYHVGVASCFREYAPQLSMHKISGSSAGALVAAAHLCGNLQLAYATTDILSVAIDAMARTLGPFHPSFDINAIVRDALERGLPDDVHVKVSGKLHISLTRAYDMKNVIVSKFDSKEEVIQALICSCFIPIWSGFVAPKYKGESYIDGGFSNNLLILDDKTITVSPFAGETDICPQDEVNNLLSVNLSNLSFSLTPHNFHRLSHALLPPKPEVLSELCEQGFADGIRFLQRMNLISCSKCLEIRSSLLLTSCSSTTTTASTTTTTTSTTTTTATITSETSEQFLEQQTYSTHQTQLYKQQQQQQEDVGSLSSELDEDNCDGCLLRSQNALCDPLPKQYSDRIRKACDTVNESLYNWFYSHRPIKYLSYLAAPYYLPMNISFALLLKYWQQLPVIGSELVRCAQGLKELLLELLQSIIQGRSLSSILMSSGCVEATAEELDDKPSTSSSIKKSTSESSISVKITADCRRSSFRSLTSYECCLTIVLFGRQSLLSIQ